MADATDRIYLLFDKGHHFMNIELNLNSRRARYSRLGQSIGKGGQLTFWMVGGVGVMASIYFFLYTSDTRISYLSMAIGLFFINLGLWHHFALHDPPSPKVEKTIDDRLAPNFLATLSKNMTPRSVWIAATKLKEGRFVSNHLLLPSNDVAMLLSDSSADMTAVWQAAIALQESHESRQIHAGTVAAVLITSSEAVMNYLLLRNLKAEDVKEVFDWLQRLTDYLKLPKPYFGGIGRDWANGYTPTLEKYSTNVSLRIQNGGSHSHFLAHMDVADSIIHDLSQGAGGVAIVGQTGTGKTELVGGLAERLLEGKDQGLKHYQVVSLNASLILASEQKSLERLMLTLFGEAIQAGNIILFLDEAQLFFGSGLGAFNMAQLLLPVLQSRRLKIIAAFTPNEFQKLKSSHEALANSLAVINVNEPPALETMKVMQDFALSIESRTGILVTYEAIREAYRLSGQYLSDLAYPGKALTVLDQSTPYSVDKVMKEESVQMAIEKTLGVKPGKANAAEADVLLNLEDKIHERMINQVQAVNAVAASLRRVRAGVTNPNRPAGSFLFLGPTGVGKTELARSLAHAYFGDSKQMIRLDMSEYQRPEDVTRLLDDGASSTMSLILAIRKQPFAVVLLDEIEKAHPNVLNLLLQLLDEGQLTDQSGKPASFKSAIVIATSNAGSQDIIARISAGEDMMTFERPLIDKLIASGQFKPELINRFDDVVLFRPLNEGELTQVARLMIGEVNKNLAKQNIIVELTEEALAAISKAGYDPQFGARPMRHIIQRTVEDVAATRILQGKVMPGSTMTLTLDDIKGKDPRL